MVTYLLIYLSILLLCIFLEKHLENEIIKEKITKSSWAEGILIDIEIELMPIFLKYIPLLNIISLLNYSYKIIRKRQKKALLKKINENLEKFKQK